MSGTLGIALFRAALLIVVFAFTLSAQDYFHPSGDVGKAISAQDELDPSFGAGGKVMTDFFGNNDQVNGIAIQGDGKIVAVGYVQRNPTTTVLGIARYNADGTLDSSFGTGGKVTGDVLGIGFGPVAVALQSNGKIVVGGASLDFFNGPSHFEVARFNADGSLDVSFGYQGRVVTPMSNFGDGANAVAIQPDGKIVAAGRMVDTYHASVRRYCAMVRYNTDGSLDSTFGSAGKVRGSLGDLQSVAIQPDGRIVAAGVMEGPISAPARLGVWRYNSAGAYDGGFDGFSIIGADPNLKYYAAMGLVLEPGGKIILAGFAGNGVTSYFGLIRLTSTFDLDPSFGAEGLVTTDLSPLSVGANAVGLQPDGRIVAAGYARSTEQSGDFAVARYNPDGSADLSFGNNGRVTTSFGSLSSAQALAVQPDGKVVVAGYGAGDLSQDFALARYGDYANFNLCVQDESNDYKLLLNSVTGEYEAFNCSGFMAYGTGSIVQKGGTITMQHYASDRRVLVKMDNNQHKATASIQLFSTGQSISIADRDTLNSVCSCQQ